MRYVEPEEREHIMFAIHEDCLDLLLPSTVEALVEIADAAKAYFEAVGPVYFDLRSEAAGRALEEALSKFPIE